MEIIFTTFMETVENYKEAFIERGLYTREIYNRERAKIRGAKRLLSNVYYGMDTSSLPTSEQARLDDLYWKCYTTYRDCLDTMLAYVRDAEAEEME